MTKPKPNASLHPSRGVERKPACRRRRALATAGGLCALAMTAGCSSLSWPTWGASRAPPPLPDSGAARLPWGSPVGATVPVVAPDPSYRIGPEDALEISVWKDETLKATTLVRPDGGISFPLAGDLPAAGKTAAEVRDEIVKRLARFITEPEVTVAVVRVASYRVYVIGRVNKPGDIAVGRPIDVLQALSLAGGMTPFAVEDGIRIIRRIDGRQVSIPFDFTRVRKGGDLSQNITLKSGDVLLVP